MISILFQYNLYGKEKQQQLRGGTPAGHSPHLIEKSTESGGEEERREKKNKIKYFMKRCVIGNEYFIQAEGNK